MENILNFITRRYPDEYKKRFKKRFYEHFYFKYGNTLWLRIFSLTVTLVTALIVLASFLKEKYSWLSIPLTIVILFIVNFFVSVNCTIMDLGYMDKKILIPKKYNAIAIVFAILLFGLAVLIMLKTIG